MLCSKEPGLYREGDYGIRIENLIITVQAEETEFDTFYAFETVTLCPIDLDLVDVTLLTLEEKAWLTSYHATVYEKLSPFLTDDEKDWLRHETRAI
jgi:Xaa-Pro aminopeptidase